MRLKKFDKRYLLMLVIGLVVWLGSYALMFLLDTDHTVDGMTAMVEMGKPLFVKNPLLVLFLVCVLQPVVDEIGYRLWGLNKEITTIICLVFMAALSVNEILMGLLGPVFIMGFFVIWFFVKDPIKRNYYNAILTSACFSLSRVTMFGSFSLGMVLGMTFLFGLGMTLSWIVLNINFVFAVVVHVLTNCFVIIMPLLARNPAVAFTETDFSMRVAPVEAFDDSSQYLPNCDTVDWDRLDSTTTEVCFYGEPAQIYSMLLSKTNTEKDIYYDWQSVNYRFEERIACKVTYSSPRKPNWDMLCEECSQKLPVYMRCPFACDTTKVSLMNIIVVFSDGRRVNINDMDPGDEDLTKICERVENTSRGVNRNRIIEEYDSTNTRRLYCLTKESRLDKRLSSAQMFVDKRNGFTIKFEPVRSVRVVTVRVDY